MSSVHTKALVHTCMGLPQHSIAAPTLAICALIEPRALMELDFAFQTCRWAVPASGSARFDEILSTLGSQDFDDESLESVQAWIGRSCNSMAEFVAHFELRSLTSMARLNVLRLLLSEPAFAQHAIDGLLVPFICSSQCTGDGALEATLAQMALQRWLLATRDVRGWDLSSRRVQAYEALARAEDMQRQLSLTAAEHARSALESPALSFLQSAPPGQHLRRRWEDGKKEEEEVPREELSPVLLRVLANTRWPELQLTPLLPTLLPADIPLAPSRPCAPEEEQQASKRARRDDASATMPSSTAAATVTAAAATAATAATAEPSELQRSCQQFSAQALKAAAGGAALPAKQCQQLAQQAARLIDRLSDAGDALGCAEGLLALCLWKLPDDVLASLAEAVVGSEHFRQASVCSLCTVLLLRCRELTSSASRMLLRAMEAVAKRSPEHLVQCCFARVMCAPPTHPTISVGYLAMLPARPAAALPTAAQCEMVQRACRQMMAPDALEALVFLMCSPHETMDAGGGEQSGAGACAGTTRALPKGLSETASQTAALLDGLLSPLAGLPLAPARTKGRDATVEAAAGQVRDLSQASQTRIATLWRQSLKTTSASASAISDTSTTTASGATRGPEFLKTLHALVSSCPTLSADSLAALFAHLEDVEAAGATDEAGKWLASIVYACVCKFPAGVKPLVGVGRSILRSRGGLVMARSALDKLDKL